MYPKNYNVSNNRQMRYPNSTFSNENVRWVRQEDRFGGSVWVPLILGGAVGYAFGNNNNNNNNPNFRPCCGGFYPMPTPYWNWGTPSNNNFFF